MFREKSVCYKCLKTDHRTRECRTGPPCGVDGCRKPHHQLLHPPTTRKPPRHRSPTNPTRAFWPLEAPLVGPNPDRPRPSLRNGWKPRGGKLPLRHGAKVSFIRKDVAEVLGLTESHERCRFTTLGGRVGPERKWRRVEFRLGAVESSCQTEASTLVQALAIPRRSDGAPAGTKPEMGQRRETPLMIDVLIGIDYYYEFVTGRMRRRATGGPVALETVFGWVVCERTSPRRTAEVESFLTNPENSPDVLLRKNVEIDEVEILPEEDVPEKNKEAREKREHTSTSGAEKCRVSLPRGQRGLPNIVKRTGRQLAIVKRGLKGGSIEKDQAKPAPETCSLSGDETKAIFCPWLRSTKQNAFDCGWSREVFLQELLRVLVLCWNGKRNFHLSAICLHPTGDGHSKVEAMLKALKEDVEESERLREKRNLMKKSMEIQKKQSLWLRFKNEMQHYYHGFKLLYIDVKVCLRLLRRLLTGETLMRKERRQLIRTTSDLFRLVPFLIFIIVPFMEFALPLVLKFFPGLLPSTFQEEHKEQEKRNKALKVKLDMAKFLQDTLEDLSLERKKNSDGLNQLTEFSAFMKKIREEGGGYVSNDDLLKYSKFFEDELTLDSLSYAQLRALCLIVGIQPIGTTNMLLLQLRLKLRELKADDQLIVKEGIDSLSESELQTACRARGMRALGVPVSRLKAQLAKWLELSLNEQVPPSLLLLSSTLYIQEDVPFSVRLKTILSTLPSHIADEAKIKLAEIEGVRVDNKTKFDLIVSLEEALKKEAEEQRSKQKEKGVAQKATVVRSPTEEVEAVVKAASVPVTESDVLLDSAPLVKDKSTQIDAPIESSELREIEHLVETVKGPLNEVKDDLIELKEQVQEHKEEVEEVQSIFKSRGDDVKVSKAARLLQSQVDRLVERVDKLVDRMEGKKIIATVDEKQIDPSAIAKHEKKMATLSEVLAPLKQLKQMPNEAKMKRIYQVLEAFDEDRDGAIDLDLALKVIDLMMKESVEINSEQVNKALEILKKEEDLLGESAASDSVEKKSKNGKGLHQSKLAQ
ncbi:LETM1 and EF-hand domain-containing protein 1, mitochondrial [Trichinella britovi]|uniref:LETM1 and EF-hand domain-containing protein 1, mitochondrial n=1 Tax=Trichinella britovi TaxID=45882 RepID=A0A0V1D5J9_TRIBR|nr:LETM1 and EF-hand domain-containing protein 1, mitochondrial [Trichinella britovi]